MIQDCIERHTSVEGDGNLILKHYFRLPPLFASQDLLENASETFIFTSEFYIFKNDAFMVAKRMTESGVTEFIQNALHNEHYRSTQSWGFSTMIPSGRFSNVLRVKSRVDRIEVNLKSMFERK